jgi:hypothetical protein
VPLNCHLHRTRQHAENEVVRQEVGETVTMKKTPPPDDSWERGRIMQFEGRYRSGIADGSITLTFRRWKRRQAVAGHRYRTAAGILHVESVDVVGPSSVTDREALRAGYASARDLITDLRGTDGDALYRVEFRPVMGPDPRSELA